MQLNQIVTYWPKGERNGFGQIEYEIPRIIKARWEDKQMLFIDDSGEESTSRAVVYSEMPLAVEGYLFQGETAEQNPISLAAAYRIKAAVVMRNLKADKSINKSWL